MFTKPNIEAGGCPNVSVEFYAPPTDKGGCNNISVVFEPIGKNDDCGLIFWKTEIHGTVEIEGEPKPEYMPDDKICIDNVSHPITPPNTFEEDFEFSFKTFRTRDKIKLIRAENAHISEIPTRLDIIESLYLYGNDFDDKTIPPLRDSSLTHLDLGQNELVGGIPSLPVNLIHLVLKYNHYLGGSIPILPMPLEHINIEQCALIGGLHNFPPLLKHINMKYNNLTGNISTLPTPLEYLDLSHNELDGNIPTFADNLEYVDLRFNALTGSISIFPQSIKYVDLTDNELTGQIPTIPLNLEYLKIGQNQLTGQIPTLPDSLTHLNVTNNQLTAFTDSGLSSCAAFYAVGNQLDVQSVDLILQKLSENSATDGECVLYGGDMGIPTNTAAIDTLRGRGWNVMVEGGY